MPSEMTAKTLGPIRINTPESGSAILGLLVLGIPFW